jgi:hypothetical protein
MLNDRLIQKLSEQIRFLQVSAREYDSGNEAEAIRSATALRVSPVEKPGTLIVPAYGIGFPGDPGSQRRAKKLVQYRVNTVWWQKNVMTPEDEEEAE